MGGKRMWWFYLASLAAAASMQGAGQTVSGRNETTLHTETNLVTVRVVVRDSKGQVVTGLKKEDFKLLDRGKEQAIAAFEEEAVTGVSTPSFRNPKESSSASGSIEGTTTPPAPRLVALYFDDLNTTQADLIHARDAAERFLADGVAGTDKIAIFSSDSLLTDFTSDHDTILGALAKLNGSSHVKQAVRRCPDISEYQAQELLRDSDVKNSSVWQLALAEDNQCSGKPPASDSSPDSSQIIRIRAIARQIADQSTARTRGNLDQIEKLTKYMSKLKGQRTIVLVSSGFLSGPVQDPVDRIIDEALRSEVVISALDPKGLKMTMREMDASRPIIAQNERTLANTFAIDQAGTVESADVLVEFVRGTGGQFFHNDNDLAGGFATLAGHPDTYVLSFAPTDLKKDGKFHEVRVLFASKQKGLTLVARRGYFARENDPSNAALTPAPAMKPASTTITAVSGSSAPMDERIRTAMLASTDSDGLPIEVAASLNGEEASLDIHLDAHTLPFRKDGDHSVDVVTFAAGLFGENDTVETVKQRSAKLDVTPEELKFLVEHGLDLKFTFPVKTGTYRLRVVVTESEGHKIGSASKTITKPNVSPS